MTDGSGRARHFDMTGREPFGDLTLAHVRLIQIFWAPLVHMVLYSSPVPMLASMTLHYHTRS